MSFYHMTMFFGISDLEKERGRSNVILSHDNVAHFFGLIIQS